jgi:hypothetical protein
MKHFKYAVSFMTVLALVLVFIGCAKPPEAEKSAAKAALEKAAGAAEAGKKAMTDEVNAVVVSLEEGWKNLETAAKNVEKKMKDKKDAWAADTKTFLDGLQATKDMIASDPAGAKAKSGELKSILDKWDAAFKELAAAPAKPVKKEKK